MPLTDNQWAQFQPVPMSRATIAEQTYTHAMRDIQHVSRTFLDQYERARRLIEELN